MEREYTHEDYESKTCSKMFTIKVDSSLLPQHALDVVNRVRPIFKVRPQLRGGGDDDIFAPQHMPIGPYHLDISSPATDKEKMRSVRLLQNLSDSCTEASLRGLMEDLELLARKCYADGASDMISEQFTSMLLNDGCYLLLFFVDYVSSDRAPPPCHDSEGLATSPVAVSRNTLVRDMVFLLENQIPLIVLQRLHELVTGTTTSSVVDCIAAPVQELLQKMLFISKKPRPAPPEPCSHLLHLVHAYFQPTVSPVPGKKSKARRHRPTGRWRRATEYMRYANVRFRVREFVDDVASSVLDVQLRRGGTLWVPRLRVDSNTWAILRNLMAMEEQEHRRPVTAYCLFMSHVACTAEDVELLRRAGIVDHFLSNDEQAAQGFAELCRGVVMEVDDGDKNYLRTMWHELDERCDSRGQRLMGWFRHGQNVWFAPGILVALILLACQVIQTLHAAAGHWQRP